MQLVDLRPGDTFAEGTQDDYDHMSGSERKRNRITFDRFLGVCTTAPDRIHVKTSAGDWCIPRVAPVVLLAKRQRAA